MSLNWINKSLKKLIQALFMVFDNELKSTNV